MKNREVASIVIFLFIAFSYFAVTYNNTLENERIENTHTTEQGGINK